MPISWCISTTVKLADRLCETLWSWSANATVFPVPAPFGPVGEAYRTWRTSLWIWRPSTCQPPRWSIGPWAHGSNSSLKISTSGRFERMSWSICKVHRITAWRMTSWDLSVHRTGSAIKPPMAVTAVIWCVVAEDTTLIPREWLSGATANITGAATSRAKSASGLWRDTYANESACSHHRQPRQSTSPRAYYQPIRPGTLLVIPDHLTKLQNSQTTDNQSTMLPTRLTFVLCFSSLYTLKKKWFIFGFMNIYREAIIQKWNFSVHKSTWFCRKYPAVGHRPQENIVSVILIFLHRNICFFIWILQSLFLLHSTRVTFLQRKLIRKGFHIPSSKGFRPRYSAFTS